MSDDLLNTNNRCRACGGIVTNIPGRRRTLEQLTEIHADTCPGIARMKKKAP